MSSVAGGKRKGFDRLRLRDWHWERARRARTLGALPTTHQVRDPRSEWVSADLGKRTVFCLRCCDAVADGADFSGQLFDLVVLSLDQNFDFGCHLAELRA